MRQNNERPRLFERLKKGLEEGIAHERGECTLRCDGSRNLVIQNDADLQATQERILRFERFLAEARKTTSAANYPAMAEGYLTEIDKMQAEIREYLSRLPESIEAA